MATEPPAPPPHPGSPDPDGPDTAAAPTPWAVSFTKPPATSGDQPSPAGPTSPSAPSDAVPSPAPVDAVPSPAPSDAAPSDAVAPRPPVDTAPPADAVQPPSSSSSAAAAPTAPSVGVPSSVPVDAAPPAPPAAPQGPEAPRDPWAPPEPGSVPQAPAPQAPAPFPAPPGGGFGPPVVPGAGPYPYGTPAPFGDFAQRKPPYNGLAITALVFGLLCCLPLVGVILGVIALVQIKKKGQRGRGLAVAGIVLSTIGTLFAVLFFTTGGWAAFKGGFEEGLEEGVRGVNATADLRPGDCFDVPGASLSDLEEGELIREVEELSCDAPHDGEAFARFNLSDGAYPGESDLTDEADRRCFGQMSWYAMDTWELAQRANYLYYYPTKANWSFGDHSVVCVFIPREGELTGTLRQDEAVLDDDQLAYLEPVASFNTALAGAPFAGVDEDLPAHQEWAGEVAGELAALSDALRGHDWDGTAAPGAGQLAGEVDSVRALWEELETAETPDDFRIAWSEALVALADETGGAEELRRALELNTERPDSDSDTLMPAGSL